uniref:Uncharacterized protein n=1 Tax=Ciona intestinalis TaxID=7719 RepID=F6X8U3_CIOIN
MSQILKAYNITDETEQQTEDIDAPQISKKVAKLLQATLSAQELRKTKVTFHKIKVNKEVHDLMCTDAFQEKVNSVQMLITDLESAVDKQEVLTKRLHQPYQGPQLTLQVQHHETAVKLFEQIDASLGNLNEHCNTIEWHNYHQLSEPNIVHCLHKICTSYNEIKAKWRNLYSIRSDLVGQSLYCSTNKVWQTVNKIS